MAQPLSSEEKARAVLCRTGTSGNSVYGLSAEEIGQLAAIYDECCAPELALAGRIGAFWAERQARLDEAKAADDVSPPPNTSLFRNRKQKIKP